MNPNNPLLKSDLKPINYDQKVELLEEALLKHKENRTFKLALDDRHFLLWSKRGRKDYRLLIATTEYETDLYKYEPLIEADYYLLEMFYDRLLEFYVKYCEYCELTPEFLW